MKHICLAFILGITTLTWLVCAMTAFVSTSFIITDLTHAMGSDTLTFALSSWLGLLICTLIICVIRQSWNNL